MNVNDELMEIKQDAVKPVSGHLPGQEYLETLSKLSRSRQGFEIYTKKIEVRVTVCPLYVKALSGMVSFTLQQLGTRGKCLQHTV